MVLEVMPLEGYISFSDTILLGSRETHTVVVFFITIVCTQLEDLEKGYRGLLLGQESEKIVIPLKPERTFVLSDSIISKVILGVGTVSFRDSKMKDSRDLISVMSP
ncbi:hypothetical protein J6590_067706 [Homalodisca vitripennis]|nr:hypothetical protein J6590_067706 [Homalodisca vitripennis]